MLYQVETAAREICRTIEGVTVVEYERQIEDLLNAASFSCAGARAAAGGRPAGS